MPQTAFAGTSIDQVTRCYEWAVIHGYERLVIIAWVIIAWARCGLSRSIPHLPRLLSLSHLIESALWGPHAPHASGEIRSDKARVAQRIRGQGLSGLF